MMADQQQNPGQGWQRPNPYSNQGRSQQAQDQGQGQAQGQMAAMQRRSQAQPWGGGGLKDLLTRPQ